MLPCVPVLVMQNATGGNKERTVNDTPNLNYVFYNLFRDSKAHFFLTSEVVCQLAAG